MALGIARGMQALEESDPPILHRDLKPSNVLLDARAPLAVIRRPMVDPACVFTLIVWDASRMAEA